MCVCEIVAFPTPLSTPKPTSDAATFGHLLEHLQKVEELKKKVTEDNEITSKQNKTAYSLEDDIRETLAKMEGVPSTSQPKKKTTRRNSEVESDWEEVQGKLYDRQGRETSPKVKRFVCKMSVKFNWLQNQDHLRQTALINAQEHPILDSYPIQSRLPS